MSLIRAYESGADGMITGVSLEWSHSSGSVHRAVNTDRMSRALGV